MYLHFTHSDETCNPTKQKNRRYTMHTTSQEIRSLKRADAQVVESPLRFLVHNYVYTIITHAPRARHHRHQRLDAADRYTFNPSDDETFWRTGCRSIALHSLPVRAPQDTYTKTALRQTATRVRRRVGVNLRLGSYISAPNNAPPPLSPKQRENRLILLLCYGQI